MSEYVPVAPPQLQSTRLVQISCGGLHSAAITQARQCLTWGNGGYGQLGNGRRGWEVFEYAPYAVPLPHRVTMLACGGSHMAALTESGAVFSWGRGDNGRLGTGMLETTGIPGQVVGLPSHVTRIACGGFSSAALTAGGELYAWGGGLNGELGTGEQYNEHEPVLVRALSGKHVVHVAIGGMHTVVLTDDGEVYTYGFGRFGQLGHGQLGNEVLPRRVERLRGVRVTAIAAGGSHTLATDGTTIFSWGTNRDGALGRTQGRDTWREPESVEGLPPNAEVVAIGAGGGYSAAMLATQVAS